MKLYQIDAFTDKPFRGNPAGVCLLEKEQDEAWMQDLAAEMNLSETAFILEEGAAYRLRWFTPAVEVSLCGHATLASAHALWQEEGLEAGAKIRFATKSGLLTAEKQGNWIQLDFPVRTVAPCEGDSGVESALGMKPTATSVYDDPKGKILLLEAENETVVRELSPEFSRLLATEARAVIVTSRSDDSRFDFVSRFFAPAVGIPEDPVTGSAHCYLAPYWATKLGKKELLGHQISRRTGVIGCTWKDDRVLLRGKAVTVFRADLSREAIALA